MKPLRVVLDTDVVAAGFMSATGMSRRWIEAAIRGELILIASLPLALEYQEILARADVLERAGATSEDARNFIDLLLASANDAGRAFLWQPSLPDPDDEMILETAINGQAQWIVTFNVRDFRAAAEHGIFVGRPDAAWRKLMEKQ
jgi:putative PIN family toxin of toxin-antitoxin system